MGAVRRADPGGAEPRGRTLPVLLSMIMGGSDMSLKELELFL